MSFLSPVHLIHNRLLIALRDSVSLMSSTERMYPKTSQCLDKLYEGSSFPCCCSSQEVCKVLCELSLSSLGTESMQLDVAQNA